MDEDRGAIPVYKYVIKINKCRSRHPDNESQNLLIISTETCPSWKLRDANHAVNSACRKNKHSFLPSLNICSAKERECAGGEIKKKKGGGASKKKRLGVVKEKRRRTYGTNI